MPQDFDVSPTPESPTETTGQVAEEPAAPAAPTEVDYVVTAGETVAADAPPATAATESPSTTLADTPTATAPLESAAEVASPADSSNTAAAAASSEDSSSAAAAASSEDSSSAAAPALKVGDRVRGRVVSIGEEETLVELAGPTPARLRTAEIRDRSGTVLLRESDRFTSTVGACIDGIVLTLGKKRGVLDAARLRLALEQRANVSGTVQALNKGGFEIRIGRVRAFCPLSQIDVAFVLTPESYLGKTLPFRVLRWENHGRNIVVSRRSVLREEAKTQARELRKQLSEGAEVEGVVKRLQPFGAFVDLGGLEGLVHVSRMGHSRVEDPASILTVGGKVRVRVVKIEHPGTRRERIALALADLGPDPWAQVQEQLHAGDVLTGTVVRLAPFGAFVHLPVGLDGLVHLSELSHQHIAAPQDVVTPGQEVQVKVLQVDVEKRRISLSLRRAVEPEAPPPRRREPRRERAPRPRDKPPAAAAGGISLTHTMAEQLGLLKQKFRGSA
ncbi:MAG TPA: S1 RNA-binding domain-containing protein [Candidatus Krumholzibacteria bacterium]|nr:S1 RNA-binding domain-containing protein [Candidatus Krumholzibacteria bacterium]